MARFFKWFAAIFSVLIVIAAGVVGYSYYLFTTPGPLAKTASIVVPKGAGLDRVTRELTKAKIIENPVIFRLWVQVLGAGRKIKAGEFRFPRNVSQREALRIVIEGKTVLRRFTIPEGWTTWQILARLKRVKGLSGDITLKPKEGTLMPDTYLFAKGETRDQVIRRMQAAMTKALDRAWESRLPDVPLKSKQEALILASIIEKETGKSGERARIGGVFANRIRKGMKLETDPTVIYGITEGKGPLGRRLLFRDLRNKHKWNTYVHAGLPPTPIANPGRRALMAAVRPMKHDDFFFVADGTGGHVFAKTFKEHKKNVAKWRKIRRRLEREGKR